MRGRLWRICSSLRILLSLLIYFVAIEHELFLCADNGSGGAAGRLMTIDCEFRQAWKGAAVAVDSGVRFGWWNRPFVVNFFLSKL